MKFNLLRAAFDGLLRLDDFAGQVDDAFRRDTLKILDHLFGGGFTLEDAGLNSGESFSENDEATISFAPNSMKPGSDQYFLSLMLLVDIFDCGPDSVGAESGLNYRIVSEEVGFPINILYLFLGFHDC